MWTGELWRAVLELSRSGREGTTEKIRARKKVKKK
jgi:hypothetical protein